MRSRIVVAAVLLTGPALLGAECSPTRPHCEGLEACAEIENPLRSCINFCAEAWDPASSDPNRCPLDPCEAEAFADPEVRLCPTEYRCSPGLATPLDGIGQCVPAVGEFFAECGLTDSVGPFDRCGNGLVCLATSCSQVQDFGIATRLDLEPESVCFVPRRAGQTCDSNLSDRDSPDAPQDSSAVGCAPCEYGTWCVPDEVSGYNSSVEGASHCLRTCENEAGEPDGSQCGCGNQLCTLDAGEPFVDPVSRATIAQHFCEPCIDLQHSGCSSGTICCDQAAGAECVTPRIFSPDPESPSMVAESMVCCFPEGASCQASTGGLDQCCAGTACLPTPAGGSACALCGTDVDEDVQDLQCCPGYASIGTGPNRRCAPCADVRTALGAAASQFQNLACGDETFSVISSGGDRDVAFVPDPERAWPRAFQGAVGGELVSTLGDTFEVEHSLHPDHRAWLFDRPLDGGISVGANMAWLRSTDPGMGPVREVLPRDDLQSFRIYDGGACSLRLDWDSIAALITTRLNSAIARSVNTTSLVDGLTFSGLTVAPVIAAQSTAVGGLVIPQDRATLVASYSAVNVASCANPYITITAGLSLRVGQGYVVTSATRDVDATAVRASDWEPDDPASVGCHAEGGNWECLLPIGGSMSLLRRAYPRRAGYFVGESQTLLGQEHELAKVGCVIDRDHYRCRVPVFLDDPLCDRDIDPDCPCPTTDLSCYRENDPYEPQLYVPAAPMVINRPVRWIEGSRDLIVDFTSPAEVDLAGDGCILEPIMAAILERQINSRLDKLQEAMDGVLARLLADSFVGDFGYDPATLPSCGLGADGEPDDEPCWGNLIAGGQRHGCALVGSAYLCDAVHFEPRRINIRPDGIEIVLAEDPGDPQFPLAQTLTDPTTLTGLCQYSRYSVDETEDRVLLAGTPVPLLGDETAFCSSTASDCADICPQAGAACRYIFAPEIAGLRNIPSGPLTCSMGQCCNSGGVCALDPLE